MSKLVLSGDTSGSVTLDAPAVSGTTTLTLPTTSGTVLTSAGGAALGTPTSGTLTSCTGLPLTTGVTGTLPVANGGTGTTTPSLVGGTNITISGSWPNQTVTAAGGGVTSLNGQTGAITNTDLYAIGSYVTGRPQNATNYVVNSTIAGSSLYSAPPGNRWNNSTSAWVNPSGNAPGYENLINTGTWRCTSAAVGFSATQNYSGVWVRIS